MATGSKRPTTTSPGYFLDPDTYYHGQATATKHHERHRHQWQNECFGTRKAQQLESAETDAQTRMEQLAEFKWSLQKETLTNYSTLLRREQRNLEQMAHTRMARIQNDHRDKITGCSITPGLPQQQSPFRSKLG
jgi:hypothetical protein